jgi:protocatechuate 3,4-dioxygenase alpha subunit
VTLARTPSQTVGPYYAIGLCRRAENELVPGGVMLSGRLLDGDDRPVIDGMIELWDPFGLRFARSGTHPEGAFSFVIAKPDAPDGQAPFLYVHVFARGLLKHQLTRLYFPDEAAANTADPVLTAVEEDRRALLVAEQDDDGLRFDIRMQGDRETVFFTA